MSLNQGLRAQKAIRALKPSQAGLTRSLATPVHSSTTQSTTLSNGFTVRTIPAPLTRSPVIRASSADHSPTPDRD